VLCGARSKLVTAHITITRYTERVTVLHFIQSHFTFLYIIQCQLNPVYNFTHYTEPVKAILHSCTLYSSS